MTSLEEKRGFVSGTIFGVLLTIVVWVAIIGIVKKPKAELLPEAGVITITYDEFKKTAAGKVDISYLTYKNNVYEVIIYGMSDEPKK